MLAVSAVTTHPLLAILPDSKLPQVDDVTAFLQARVPQCNVMQYHAGMSPNERDSAHRQFLTGKCRVIVATVAFGMGIDKPDIRRVFHLGPPKTVEEYYQQIGPPSTHLLL